MLTVRIARTHLLNIACFNITHPDEEQWMVGNSEVPEDRREWNKKYVVVVALYYSSVY
jgi:hypothetical protein